MAVVAIHRGTGCCGCPWEEYNGGLVEYPLGFVKGFAEGFPIGNGAENEKGVGREPEDVAVISGKGTSAESCGTTCNLGALPLPLPLAMWTIQRTMTITPITLPTTKPKSRPL